MEILKMSRWTYAFGLSLAITSMIDAIIVVVKESNKQSVLAWMQSITGHHWVTQGIISLTLFFVLAIIFSQINSGKGIALAANVFLITIIGAVSISSAIITSYFIV